MKGVTGAPAEREDDDDTGVEGGEWIVEEEASVGVDGERGVGEETVVGVEGERGVGESRR